MVYKSVVNQCLNSDITQIAAYQPISCNLSTKRMGWGRKWERQREQEK